MIDSVHNIPPAPFVNCRTFSICSFPVLSHFHRLFNGIAPLEFEDGRFDQSQSRASALRAKFADMIRLVADNAHPYFFILQRRERRDDDPHGTPLPNDTAAKEYAQRVIRELKEAGGYDDPDLKMIVKNAAGDVIYSIPF